MRRRDLTSGESGILKMIQEGYGSQNTVDEVFFTDADEAALFVKASNGTSTLMANLTSLAAWRAGAKWTTRIGAPVLARCGMLVARARRPPAWSLETATARR